MGARNPLTQVAEAAKGAARLPLRITAGIADRAVEAIASGTRLAADLIRSTSGRPEQTRAPREQKVEPREEPAEDWQESVEELAEAAVAREMAEEPQPTTTPSQAARNLAPTRSPKPERVYSTSTTDTEDAGPAPEAAEPEADET